MIPSDNHSPLAGLRSGGRPGSGFPASPVRREIGFRRLVTAWALSCLVWPLALAADAEQSPGDEQTEGFSVMTWNLEWFYDEMQGDNYSRLAKEKSAPDRERWDWRRDAVAESIAEVKPTIVAVQEIESRRVLWYLTRALERNHQLEYRELAIEGRDYFTEQDVGLLVRPPVEALSVSRYSLPARLRERDEYGNVSKHLLAELEVPVGDRTERVAVLTLHLRARPEAEAARIAQTRSIRHWIASRIAAGQHVVVLGDTNSEELTESIRPGSDLDILLGGETSDPRDDLIDLHRFIPRDERRTHLLPGKEYDRILVSPSLVEDDPARLDLALGSVEVRGDLAIRGDLDEPTEHWERYWEIPEPQRDLSDHLPVLATFEVR